MNRLYNLIVPAAVLTTVSRHIIAALQLEGVVVKGFAWDAILVALALAFAALEGVALVQLEDALARAADAERKSLRAVRLAIYVTIPLTFIAPLVAQAQGVTVSTLLSAWPVAMWILAALNVAAPMFVISGSAMSAAVLRNVSRKDERKGVSGAPGAQAERVSVKAPERKQLTVSVPEAAPEVEPEPTAARKGTIDGAQLAAMLAAKPAASSVELAQAFGVSPSAIRQSAEWRGRK